MSRGGRRPGAGRPKGTKGKSTLEGIESRRIFLEGVARHHQMIFNAMLDSALGLCYQGKNGRIYTKKNEQSHDHIYVRSGVWSAGVAKDEVYHEPEPDYSYIKKASPEEVDTMVKKLLGK